jgi:beta-alanine--pyruvate transaminase
MVNVNRLGADCYFPQQSVTNCDKAPTSHSFEVTPDILTMAKGFTDGAVPMGAVAFRDEICHAVVDATPGAGVEFFHGCTSSGHLIACAAGLATLDIYKNEGLFERGARCRSRSSMRYSRLRDLPLVTDIRGYGMLGALDLVRRPARLSDDG